MPLLRPVHIHDVWRGGLLRTRSVLKPPVHMEQRERLRSSLPFRQIVLVEGGFGVCCTLLGLLVSVARRSVLT